MSTELPCPQCGAHVVVMTGDGVIETVCHSCGFVMRQHPAKAVPHEPVDIVPRVTRDDYEPITFARVRPPSARFRVLWLIGWLGAFYAIRVMLVGQDWFLPIYLANGYLGLFEFVILVHRAVLAPSARRLPDGAAPTMGLFFGTMLIAVFAMRFAPRIGERDFCTVWNPARVFMGPLPPHAYRCVQYTYFFAGWVVGCWTLGWLMIWWTERDTA